MSENAYMDMTHQEMKRALVTAWRELGVIATTEQPLPNGARADVFVLLHGMVLIYECKTDWRENYFRIAAHKYGAHCDFLLIATPPGLRRQSNLAQALAWFEAKAENVGLIEVSWNGVKVIRHPANRYLEKQQPRLARAVVALRDAAIGSPACTAGKH
jgi:hypothetical protein